MLSKGRENRGGDDELVVLQGSTPPSSMGARAGTHAHTERVKGGGGAQSFARKDALSPSGRADFRSEQRRITRAVY